jgi:predicted patatin/cPLA2 family phospholipase
MDATNDRLDKILDVLQVLVGEMRDMKHDIRDMKQDIRDLRSDQRKVLEILLNHSDRIDRLERRSPATH